MSDQDWADKAARKVYQFCVDLIHDGADSPLYRDRYEKIASLIRSAAPSSALVDAANKAIDSSHSDNPQDWLDAIDALRAALSAQEPKVLVGCEKIADAIITFRCETSQEPFNGVEFKDFIMEQLSRPTLLRCALALVAEEFDSMKWWECYDALRAALEGQGTKVCEWVDDDPFWIISCQKVGLSHSCHEPVIVRKWKACPYCTNPIEVKE